MAFRLGVRIARSSVLLQEHIEKSNPVMHATHPCWDAVHVSKRPPMPAARLCPPLFGNMSTIPGDTTARLAELSSSNAITDPVRMSPFQWISDSWKLLVRPVLTYRSNELSESNTNAERTESHHSELK
jgi:hypothetical protein